MAATWGGAPPGFSLGGFSRICRLTITSALASEFTSPLILHRWRDMLTCPKRDHDCAGSDTTDDFTRRPLFAGHMQICEIVQSRPALAWLGCRCAGELAIRSVLLHARRGACMEATRGALSRALSGWVPGWCRQGGSLDYPVI